MLPHPARHEQAEVERTFRRAIYSGDLPAANKCVPPRGSSRKLGATLAILTSDNGSYDEPLTNEISVKGALRVFLAVDFEKEVFQFSHDGTNWIPIGPDFGSAKLSDEHCGGRGFTGTFIAILYAGSEPVGVCQQTSTLSSTASCSARICPRRIQHETHESLRQ